MGAAHIHLHLALKLFNGVCCLAVQAVARVRRRACCRGRHPPQRAQQAQRAQRPQRPQRPRGALQQ